MTDASAPPSRRASWTDSIGGVVDTFKGSPVLLLIVLLNGFFIGAAGYYLLQVEHYRADDRKALAQLLDRCITHTVPLDYLQQRKE